MITKRTVFVLGAGASEPYGFPLGAGLVDEAVTLLQAGTDTRVPILEAVTGRSKDALRQFGHELERAASPSIDAFLEGRPAYIEIGKAVIANIRRLGDNSFTNVDREWGLKLAGTVYDLGDAEVETAKRLLSGGNGPGLLHGTRDWDVLTLLRERWT